MVTRVVVCAANKYGESKLFIGVRHFCPMMVAGMEGHDIPWMRKEFGEVQGFIDQYGVFMDRVEALEVATAAGQIGRYRPKTAPTSKLFSEDIY